ncbi:peptide/nickel transport system permease protein [Phyllobacterium trifolii]|uniref:Peptide/nickel transport system permease protein n=1 Tax=Phyllobacterium trifolii TaxID=300193 RepID=A0A839ULL4_9HYPH|nr:ABC transporter permease [Phyllobacterium trifolii]MBB3149501.1 peptide/nickel transport system permease protein [Phyllobacterium trifolii]
MENVTSTTVPVRKTERTSLRQSLDLLWRDKFAVAAVLFLIIVVLAALLGPYLFGQQSNRINLLTRNAAPSFAHGWAFVLGADALGRPILLRLFVGAQNTIILAVSAVILSMIVGTALGFVAGYRNDWLGNVILRVADVLMSFPSLLLALIVLYVLTPGIANVILVLAITRVPIYLRTARAEVLEVRERTFVTAADIMGASTWRLVWRHIRPAVMPTLVTIATLEIAFVMLAESSLSFLGLGIQAPQFTWGAMVAQGQSYLGTAWWVAFWPGVAITLTAMSLNLLANWVRLVSDPVQRWRLEAKEPSHD